MHVASLIGRLLDVRAAESPPYWLQAIEPLCVCWRDTLRIKSPRFSKPEDSSRFPARSPEPISTFCSRFGCAGCRLARIIG